MCCPCRADRVLEAAPWDRHSPGAATTVTQGKPVFSDIAVDQRQRTHVRTKGVRAALVYPLLCGGPDLRLPGVSGAAGELGREEWVSGAVWVLAQAFFRARRIYGRGGMLVASFVWCGREDRMPAPTQRRHLDVR